MSMRHDIMFKEHCSRLDGGMHAMYVTLVASRCNQYCEYSLPFRNSSSMGPDGDQGFFSFFIFQGLQSMHEVHGARNVPAGRAPEITRCRVIDTFRQIHVRPKSRITLPTSAVHLEASLDVLVGRQCHNDKRLTCSDIRQC